MATSLLALLFLAPFVSATVLTGSPVELKTVDQVTVQVSRDELVRAYAKLGNEISQDHQLYLYVYDRGSPEFDVVTGELLPIWKRAVTGSYRVTGYGYHPTARGWIVLKLANVETGVTSTFTLMTHAREDGNPETYDHDDEKLENAVKGLLKKSRKSQVSLSTYGDHGNPGGITFWSMINYDIDGRAHGQMIRY